MANVVIPGKPLQPIVVSGQESPAVSVTTGVAGAFWGNIFGDIASQADLQAALAAKQATLVSAVNIKTVNGSSLLGAGDLAVSGSGGVTDGDKGDISVTGTGTIWTVDPGAITLSKMANLAASTILGNNTGIAATPIALTAAQTTAMLDVFTGALKGLAPASGGGTANFLRADGTWAAPAGGGDMVLASAQTNSGLKTYLDATFGLRNVANTFTALFTNAITAARTYTLKDASGTLAFTSDITGVNSGTNTGDQTSIAGITGTKAQFDTAVTDGNFQYVGDAPTAHTHLLAAGATDVTVTAANLNALDDGLNTALHFHDADRARANHTGTQLAATISDFSTAADARIGAASINALADVIITTPATGQVIKYNGANWINDTDATGGGGVTDGDKGDITVSAAGATWTIDAGVVTLAKQADVASGSVFYRKTAAAGAPEVQTLATLKTDLGLTGTNSGDQTITLTGDVTGTGTGSFAATIAANAVTEAKIIDGAVTSLKIGVQAVTVGRIANDAVTNVKLADVPTATFKGRVTAATGDPEDLTGAQATTLLSNFVASGVGSAKGLVPDPGVTAGTTRFLREDATWAAPGGGGAPGGATTQIQYNAAGAFAGDADLTWDATGNTLGLGGVNTGIQFAGITAEPAAPPAGMARLYMKSIAGRMSLKSKGPSGLDVNYQTAVWGSTSYRWTTTTATAGVWQNTVGAGAGTFTSALPTTTNLYTTIRRSRWANVVTTLNQVLGQRNTEAVFFRGGAAGQGGFFFAARCGFDVWTNGGRFFAGMATASTVVSGNPSALNNTVGFCVDAADAGAISFLTRGTVATKAATGFTIVSNRGYDVFIYCAPNSAEYSWRIVDIVAGTEANGVATLNLPTNTVMQSIGVLASNAALTPVTSIQLGVNGIYVETDY